MLKSDNLKSLLKSIPLFANFPEDELAKVEQLTRRKEFKKNAVILQENETGTYMYIVFSGKIKVVQMNEEGKEQIVAIHKKGDFFGEMSLLDGKTQPAIVMAMEATTVGLISKSDFEAYLLKDEHVVRQIILLLCDRLRDSWLMLKVLSFADAENRVRAVLTHVSALYGIKDTRGTIIPWKLTHKEIADYASLARETVSRLLSRFSRTGEIEILDNRNIVLKPNFVRKSAVNS